MTTQDKTKQSPEGRRKPTATKMKETSEDFSDEYTSVMFKEVNRPTLKEDEKRALKRKKLFNFSSSTVIPYYATSSLKAAAPQNSSRFLIMEQKISRGKVGLSEFYLEKCRHMCPICTFTKFHFNELSTDKAPPSRCSQWSKRENVFLTGIIMAFYHLRHSLKPTNIEKKLAEKQGLSSKKLIWQFIWERFHVACERFYRLTGEETPRRTIEALQKHWKETGERNLKLSEFGMSHPETKVLERLWDEKYNLYFVLTCSDEIFENLMKEIIENQQDNCSCMQLIFN